MSDPTRLTGWGRVTASYASVLSTCNEEEVSAAVSAAGSDGVVARGLGRSYGDAAQNASGVVVAPIEPDAPIELDSARGRVHATAGTSLERLLRFLLPRGWRLPVLPGTRFVTVGGAIAADVHGKNHHVDGSFSRWVHDLRLVDGRGYVRDLAPDRDPAAFWATVGGMGLTGVVTSATLAVEPVVSTSIRARTTKFTDLDAVMDAMERSPARYHVAWVDAARGSGFGRSVLDEGDHAETPDEALRYAPRVRVAAPPLPVNIVQPWVVAAFNKAWWRRARDQHETLVPLTKFFHPLDGVAQWPRLYGPSGFLQWQMAVPFTARHLVEESLRALVAAHAVPSLVVLKRFGASSPAPLSFPIPGWTLAVDIAAGHPGLRPVLDRLDEQVADAGGRIYLAKDARADAATVARMYPRLAEWREERDRLDPDQRLCSDLARRLKLA